MSAARHAVFRTVADSPSDSWSSPARGAVTWWEFFGGDTTPTDELTVGSAEVPADVEHFARNTGDEPLRLLYVFARDEFSDGHYTFPGEETSEVP